jgi:hypothetical protein
LSETGLFSLELRRMRARPFMKRSTRLLAMGIISLNDSKNRPNLRLKARYSQVKVLWMGGYFQRFEEKIIIRLIGCFSDNRRIRRTAGRMPVSIDKRCD